MNKAAGVAFQNQRVAGTEQTAACDVTLLSYAKGANHKECFKIAFI